MRNGLPLAPILVGAILASGSFNAAPAALVNGDMEFEGNYSVCPGWTYYSQGTITTAQQAKELVTIHGGLASQRLSGNSGSSTARMGIRQTIAANQGDAITFDGWIYTLAAATTTYYRIAARWDGSTANPDETTTSYSAFAPTRTAWNHLSGPAGNATTNDGVTVFLDHTRRTNAAFGGYWDDVVAYQAYVPPAPSVFGPTDTSLKVDVNPGSNSGNSDAQYAITIGGGGYTLGTDWVLADGSVGASAAWQTDTLWDSLDVTGLLPQTTYTFEVMARYSSTITQATILQGEANQASGTTTPEPATLGFLALGGLAMLRRRR